MALGQTSWKLFVLLRRESCGVSKAHLFDREWVRPVSQESHGDWGIAMAPKERDKVCAALSSLWLTCGFDPADCVLCTSNTESILAFEPADARPGGIHSWEWTRISRPQGPARLHIGLLQSTVISLCEALMVTWSCSPFLHLFSSRLQLWKFLRTSAPLWEGGCSWQQSTTESC